MVLLIKNWECDYTDYSFRTGESGGKLKGIKQVYEVWQIVLRLQMGVHNEMSCDINYRRIG